MDATLSYFRRRRCEVPSWIGYRHSVANVLMKPFNSIIYIRFTELANRMDIKIEQSLQDSDFVERLQHTYREKLYIFLYMANYKNIGPRDIFERLNWRRGLQGTVEITPKALSPSLATLIQKRSRTSEKENVSLRIPRKKSS